MNVRTKYNVEYSMITALKLNVGLYQKYHAVNIHPDFFFFEGGGGMLRLWRVHVRKGTPK